MGEVKQENNLFRIKVHEFPARIFPGIGVEVNSSALIKAISDYSGIIVEIGSGSGMHLIELARRNPDKAVIGFELRYKRTVRTVEKSNKENVFNTFVVQTDANKIDEFFKESSLDSIYINFPDPWPKKKQRKNRIVNPEFLKKIHYLLKDEGLFYFKTDHREYFDSVINEVIPESQFTILEETRNLYQSKFLDKNVKTEFENLFLQNNEEINYACFCK